MSDHGDALHHRFARCDDEDVIIALMRTFYDEERLHFDPQAAQDAVHELVLHPQFGRILLFVLNDAVVGYAVLTVGFSLEFHGRYVLLDEFFLMPRVRGRGWGRHSLDLIAETARRDGFAALRLEINHANSRVRSLYLQAGFHDDQRDLFTRWL